MSRFDGDDDAGAEELERDVTPALTVGEGDFDASLRPRSLSEFIGQPRVREQLQLVLEGAKNRGGTPDHILLSGPPGLGKTSLAMIIAAELGTSLRGPSGPALERAGDPAARLSRTPAPGWARRCGARPAPRWNVRATWRPCCPTSSSPTGCSSTRSTASPDLPRR